MSSQNATSLALEKFYLVYSTLVGLPIQASFKTLREPFESRLLNFQLLCHCHHHRFYHEHKPVEVAIHKPPSQIMSHGVISDYHRTSTLGFGLERQVRESKEQLELEEEEEEENKIGNCYVCVLCVSICVALLCMYV